MKIKSNFRIKEAFSGLDQRVRSLNGHLPAPGNMDALTFDVKTRKFTRAANGLPKFLELAGALDDERMSRLVEQYKDAAKDPDKAYMLNALRITTVSNYIRAKANGLAFFDLVTLRDDERPVIDHRLRKEVSFSYITEGGDVYTSELVPANKQVYPDLRMLSSQEVSYPVWDIYQGDISQLVQGTVDIGFDLTAELEALAFTLLATAHGAFDYTNATLLNRDMSPNSRIKTSNLPSTNDVAADSITASTLPGMNVLIEIIKYVDGFRGVFSDGDLEPTGVIFCPSQHAYGFANEFKPTDKHTGMTAEQAQQNIHQFMWNGITWTIVPDPTLDPKYVYPVLNKPVGFIYEKPSLAREIIKPRDPDERFEMNRESRKQMQPYGAVIPSTHKVNALRVQYRS